MKLIFLFVVVVWSSCPHASLWLKHGAKKAAEMLSQQHEAHQLFFRKLAELPTTQLPTIGYGTCVYQNPFAGTTDCVQLSGAGFTYVSAKKVCDNAMMGMAKGILEQGTRCFASTNSLLAGHCYTVEGAQEQTIPMLMVPAVPTMATCDQVKSACTTFSRGRFVASSNCVNHGEKVKPGAPTGVAAPTAAKAQVGACQIADGPMGAAHQHALSPGYKTNCPDAPGKNSPYQWPLQWKTIDEYHSLPHKSTGKKPFSFKSTVYYDLKRNWKRMDTVNQTGPLPNTAEWMSSWKETVKNTMIHRQDKMWFIDTFSNGTSRCIVLDLGIVGNVRPDWYMDNRGAATSTQYLGNQHVVYNGKPTLVKQWRKKDFADMYFVMSVLAEPGVDGVHWPIMRNDPGEGFGDDALHIYTDQKLLTDADQELFFIDKNHKCEEMKSGTDGPPTDMFGEQIPSNLNVNDAGWFELEYTASPGTSLERAMFAAKKCEGEPTQAAAPGSFDLEGNGFFRLCSEANGKVSLKAEFNADDKSWVAIGVRPSSSPDFCQMLPAKVTSLQAKGDKWSVLTGDLPKDLKMFDVAAATLAEYEKLASVTTTATVTREDGKTSVAFVDFEEMPAPGKTLKLTYAIGKTATLSYHAFRGCVSIPASSIPKCSAVKDLSTKDNTANYAGLQVQLADIASKLESMKPNCDKFKTPQTCMRWNLQCTWVAGPTAKCKNA